MIGPLLRKEFAWSRHRALSLLFILILIPAAFAYSSVFFQSVLPRDAPVALVAEDNADGDDMRLADATFDLLSKPVVYDSRERAAAALDRETVYAVVHVPPRLADPAVDRVEIIVAIDNDVVPYREPSGALVGVVRGAFNSQLDKRVDVTRRPLGSERTLSSYLLPTFLFILVSTFAFGYLPYTLTREERALDRVRTVAKLEAAVVSKLLFLAVLLLVPIGVFSVLGSYYGYDAVVWHPVAVAVYLLVFLALGAIAAGVTFLTEFSTAGRLLNVLLLFVVVTFSGVVYPAGFFSPLRREIIRLVPTHYAIVTIRGLALKGHAPARYTDWLGGLVVFLGLSAVPLYLSLRYYEHQV